MPRLGLLAELKYRLAGYLGKALIAFLRVTSDGELENREVADRIRAEGHAVIYICWHNRLLIPVWTHRNRGVTILVSQSRDGEYVARVGEQLGFNVIRGSSTHGAEAGFRLLVDALESGNDVAITPDGPTGPKYEVKKGLISLARASGAAILPVGIAIDRYVTLASWDEFRVMIPGAYALARYGDPIYVPEHSNKYEMEEIRKKVEDTLNALNADCESRVAEARRTKRTRIRFQRE